MRDASISWTRQNGTIQNGFRMRINGVAKPSVAYSKLILVSSAEITEERGPKTRSNISSPVSSPWLRNTVDS
jgi:hypothetical protein